VSATYTDPAVCPVCDRIVATLVPRGGDGSASVYRRHLAHVGGAVICDGSRRTVERAAELEVENRLIERERRRTGP
jgi:hypothetical protein